MWYGNLATAVQLNGWGGWVGGVKKPSGLKTAQWLFISEKLCTIKTGIIDFISTHDSEAADRFVVVHPRLFGDDSDLHFWTVASHYLQSFAQTRQLSVATADGQVQSEGTQTPAQNHLDICHDVLCESSYFQVSSTL